MSVNYWQAFLDGSKVVKETQEQYLDPNSPKEKSDVVEVMNTLLQDLGVPGGENSKNIANIYADAVEAAGNGDAAPANLLNDFNKELAQHKITLPSFAQTFLLMGLATAIQQFQKLKKKA
jgi:hypothetical protein